VKISPKQAKATAAAERFGRGDHQVGIGDSELTTGWPV